MGACALCARARIQEPKYQIIPLAYFASLGQIGSPFCLQNCLFPLATYFAQNFASKFCQALVCTL